MSSSTVEVNDCVFCSNHKLEICEECGLDLREENDAFYGFDPIDRDPVECPELSINKDEVFQCKKHGNSTCSQCFGWKKQITRMRVAAKKAGRS
ncbi:hypothetical protein RSAG8_04651, partial [Rhizoctonia solani AG-8 WAC10335]